MKKVTQKNQHRKIKQHKTKLESAPNKKISSILFYEIMSVLFLFFAAFVFLSTLFPQSTGLVGYWVVDYVLKNSFGQGVFFLPVFFILTSFVLLYNRSSFRNKVSVSGLLLGGFSLFIFLELYFKGPAELLRWPISNDGGGIVGALGLFVLLKIIGYYGTWLFLTTAFIISFILIFNLSIRNLIQKLLYAEKKKEVEMLPREFIVPEAPKDKEAPLPIPVTPPKLQLKSQLKTPESPELPESAEYQYPSTDLLSQAVPLTSLFSKNRAKEQTELAQLLEEALSSFQVDAKVVNITPGPSVTRYELQPGTGVKIAKITALSKDIALKLAAADVRIEAPIPGKALIGIEVPNSTIEMVNLRSIIDKTDFYKKPSKLLCALGLTITGDAVLMDLGKMPHVLIAGATGSGKSVCINSIIMSILLKATPDEVKFLMIDPKKVELNLYEGIPHLVAPVVTDPNQAAATLKKWALLEMERRYTEFSKIGVKNIEGYNTKIQETQQKEQQLRSKSSPKLDQFTNPDENEPENAFIPKKLPYIVVIIDELADLMMVASQEVENTICRLAQMARATGIHLVIATQRPSVNVITGLIKANVPSRISFFLQSQIDSRTILDMPGAEKLLGKGDMLYSPVGSFRPKRMQGVFISEKEIINVVDHLKRQAKPVYFEELLQIEPLDTDNKSTENESGDALFEEAKGIIQTTHYASTSYLQRKLRIGYNRAARLMDELEEKGVISQYEGEKKSRSVI